MFLVLCRPLFSYYILATPEGVQALGRELALLMPQKTNESKPLWLPCLDSAIPAQWGLQEPSGRAIPMPVTRWWHINMLGKLPSGEESAHIWETSPFSSHWWERKHLLFIGILWAFFNNSWQVSLKLTGIQGLSFLFFKSKDVFCPLSPYFTDRHLSVKQ